MTSVRVTETSEAAAQTRLASRNPIREINGAVRRAKLEMNQMILDLRLRLWVSSGACVVARPGISYPEFMKRVGPNRNLVWAWMARHPSRTMLGDRLSRCRIITARFS